MKSEHSNVVIGIDIGGTEIKGGVVSSEGLLLVERRVRTPIEEGKVGMIQALHHLITELSVQTNCPILGIGIGSAGRIDSKLGKVIYATNLPLTGTMLADEVAELLQLPVYVDNDVNVAALGEAWVGAAQDNDNFAFIALGTGVGGALFSDGHILQGVSGGAGEFGHLILKPGGLACNCGQYGCLEQYVSGSALQRMAREIDPNYDSHLLLKLAGQGDLQANRALDHFVIDLAYGMVTIHNVFDPGVIVVGGGVITSSEIWWSKLLETLNDISPKSIQLTPALLGNRAGILGAAKLVYDRVTI